MGVAEEGRPPTPAGSAAMFLHPSSFPFVATLERSWEAIRDEMQAIPSERFIHYGSPSAHAGRWQVYPLVNEIPQAVGENTREVAFANQPSCPKTMALIGGIRDLSLASFSRLSPGAHIYRHFDYDDPAGYRCHLGLVTNPGARMGFGDEVQYWQDGRCLVFDPACMHEAANDGDSDRTILMIDVLASRYDPLPLDS